MNPKIPSKIMAVDRKPRALEIELPKEKLDLKNRATYLYRLKERRIELKKEIKSTKITQKPWRHASEAK